MDIGKIKSIIKCTCPKCRKGDMFENPGLIRYRKVFDMYERCPVCNHKFEMEPGFWYGALWMSYPLVVVVELPFLFMALYSTLGNPWISFGLMLVAFVLCWPLFIRLGRSIWAHVWVKFDSKI